MPLKHAYAVTNKAAALAAAAFTWSTGTTTNRSYLIDGRMDRQFALPSTATSVSVVIDFGTAVSLTAIAILNSNIAQATGGSVRVRAATDAGITTSVAAAHATTSVNTTAPRHKDHVFTFEVSPRRYWEVTFSWTGSFALRIGELFACEATVLTRYTVLGHGEQLPVETTQFKSRSGETRGHYIAGPFRTKRMVFDDLSETERNELVALHLATNGDATPLLWIHRYVPASTDAADQDVVYGRRLEPDYGWSESDHLRFDVDELVIRSLGREVGA